MQRATSYIPALKYDWLTGFFDPVIRLTMPERQFRTALIAQADLKPRQRVLDFGTGTAALSLLAKHVGAAMIPRAMPETG